MPTPTPLVRSARRFRGRLLVWYRRNARQLPWRENPSLYRTVVSEFMLQQTQVATVLPYFERWMRAFPSFPMLAAAPGEDVLRQWQGLGYYSRARNLQRLARALAAGTEPPRTVAEWLNLPGVGPYTAAAVTSITFGERAACVDGNVVRILARLTADSASYRDSASAARAFAPLAAALLPGRAPGDHNQAMMELGATVCTRRKPCCGRCPVAAFCAARARGDPESYPRLAPKRTEARSVVRIWCEREGALLLHRAGPRAARLAGIHELPTAEEAGIPAAAAEMALPLARKSRSFTRFRIRESIVALPRGRTVLPARGLVWTPLAELDAVPLSGPHRRWIREILAGREAPPGAPGKR
ncbi:MAG: A/G-specific adenine glycosylase [Opitutaceae bacterium]